MHSESYWLDTAPAFTGAQSGALPDQVDVAIVGGGLTGLSVADNEFSLSSSDWDHRVNCFDTSLQRLVHRFSTHDAWRLHFNSTHRRTNNVALAVDRQAEGVDDAAEQGVADGDRENAAGRLDGLAFLDRHGQQFQIDFGRGQLLHVLRAAQLRREAAEQPPLY